MDDWAVPRVTSLKRRLGRDGLRINRVCDSASEVLTMRVAKDRWRIAHGSPLAAS
jgi:hypothetical protein